MDAGWRQTELAPAAGLSRRTLQKRVAAARVKHDDHAPALTVDPPPPPAMTRREYLAHARVSERDWLSRLEAATLLDVDPYSLGNWRRAGLLPSTRTDRQPHLYARAELEALRDAPRYRGGGIDYAATRAALGH